MDSQFDPFDERDFDRPSDWRPHQPPEHPFQPSPPPQRPHDGGGGNRGLLIGLIGAIAALVIVAGVGVVLFMRDDDADVEARETTMVDDSLPATDRTPEDASPSTRTRTETATVTETRTRTTTPASSTDGSGDAGGSGGSDRYIAGPGQYGVGLNTYRACDDVIGTSWVGTGHSTTTCGFAENIALKLAYADISDAPLTVTAYSAATQENISMSCRRARDSERDPVFKCEGGRNAVVYVYPY
ncbi:hypothetical protein [Corynebacterium freneyi]|uniref:Serine/threonine protein kinase n=1 Tax=Corynebacterium freneyi TaxID=134034 RepID=A0ABS4UA91_9CORY|nr:hypothetical protein [Corynebacterium freneyi]MBP2333473.1 hypothetical protein [Corynebacterium freneyi]QXA52489.1 hypothetical protein I6L56_10620 [Corynebacterium freneyi]UBI02780.1 hypothetical protein LA334_02780 [Corynebacterium freneyi]WJZ04424.1 hypothetical protein CFREN_02185 [Corynebacterium freneyi]